MTRHDLTGHVEAIQAQVALQLPEDEPDHVRRWVYETAVKVMGKRLREEIRQELAAVAQARDTLPPISADALWQTVYDAAADAGSILHDDTVSAIASKLEPLRAPRGTTHEIERWLREEWWFNHACEQPNIYGDDGEMQCNTLHGIDGCLSFIDFKRTPIEELHACVMALRLKRLAEQVRAPRGTTPEEKDQDILARRDTRDSSVSSSPPRPPNGDK